METINTGADGETDKRLIGQWDGEKETGKSEDTGVATRRNNNDNSWAGLSDISFLSIIESRSNFLTFKGQSWTLRFLAAVQWGGGGFPSQGKGEKDRKVNF